MKNSPKNSPAPSPESFFNMFLLYPFPVSQKRSSIISRAAFTGLLLIGLLAPQRALACAGCAVGVDAGALAGSSASGVAGKTLVGGAEKSSLIFASMWSRMLWMMATDRDPEVQQLQQKLGQTRTLMMLGYGSVLSMGLAQSITSLAQTSQHNHDDGMHHEDHDAASHSESIAPSVMGVIGTGTSLLTFGISGFRTRQLNRQLEKRLVVLKAQTDEAIRQVKQGHGGEPWVHAELVHLVGDEAAHEFLAMMGQDIEHGEMVQHEEPSKQAHKQAQQTTPENLSSQNLSSQNFSQISLKNLPEPVAPTLAISR